MLPHCYLTTYHVINDCHFYMNNTRKIRIDDLPTRFRTQTRTLYARFHPELARTVHAQQRQLIRKVRAPTRQKRKHKFILAVQAGHLLLLWGATLVSFAWEARHFFLVAQARTNSMTQLFAVCQLDCSVHDSVVWVANTLTFHARARFGTKSLS